MGTTLTADGDNLFVECRYYHAVVSRVELMLWRFGGYVGVVCVVAVDDAVQVLCIQSRS